MVKKTAPSPTLLCFECEVRSPRLARRNRNFLRLRLIGFMPSRHRVISRWDVVDGVGAICVCPRIGAFYYHMPPMHPGMDVALYRNHFRIFPALLNRGSSRWLRLIPWDVAGHRIGERVNVVGGLIAGCDLKRLACIERQDVWCIHTILLIEHWHLCGCRRTSCPTFRNVENRILQPTICADLVGLQMRG